MSWAYEDLALLPLCLGLTAVGVLVALVAGRRFGPRAGARALAWALLPASLYLAGVVQLVWRVGTAVARFGAEVVFSPTVWLGLTLLAISLVLFVTTGLLGRRGAATSSSPRPVESQRSRRAVGSARTVRPGGEHAPGGFDGGEFDDVEEILRRRGIR